MRELMTMLVTLAVGLSLSPTAFAAPVGSTDAAAVAPLPAAQEGEQQEGQEEEGSEQESGESEYEAQVKAQLQEIRARIAPAFDETSGAVIGELAEGEANGFGFQAQAGKGYAVIGVCDADCGNLDLVLYTQDGQEIAADRGPDDLPVLRFAPREDANVVVEMIMSLCVADSCVLGVQVFAGDLEAEDQEGDG